jgi:hypothetical protein
MRAYLLAILTSALLASSSFTFAQDNPSEARPSQNAKAASPTEITFDNLKFEIAKDAKFDRKALGEKIEALHGKQVKITGYFLPTSVYMREGIKQFILQYKDLSVNDPPPKLHQVIRVEMEEGKTASFTTQPISVEGEFSIKEWAVINGRPSAIYHLKAKSITEVKNIPADPPPAK